MNREPLGAEEALLGFDAREMFLPPGAHWDAARRERYLLRRDVQKPLSVDPMVWPSLFGDGLPDDARRRLGLDTARLPAWRGPNPGLWEDLSPLQAALGLLASESHWTVAVSWVSAEGFSKPSPSAGPYRERITAPARSDAWTLLGFDVADAGLTSGLSNCGYQQAESAALRTTWAADLNANHLFTDVTRARAFQALTDRRVPEHAPFFVYALYRVEALTG